MPLPHLSQELVDGIIDHLKDDTRALRKCSVVSRSFLPTAQRHLFSIIDLDSSYQGSRICEGLRASLHLNPFLSRYIESLNFRLYWTAGSHIQPLVTTLGMLLHLRSFALRSSATEHNWATLEENLKSALLNILQQPNLISASVTGVQGFPLSIFMHCHQLKNLSIEGITVNRNEGPQNHSIPPPSLIRGRLETLSGGEWESGAGSTRALVSFLIHPRSSLRLSQLRYFAAAVRSSEDIAVFQTVINLSASSLKDLTLSIHCQTLSPLGPMNINGLTNLSHLSLTVFEDLSSPGWLLSLFTTVSRFNCIQDISLTVLFSNFDDGAWTEVDAALSEPKFGSLRTVILRYWRRYNQYQLPELKFPSLASKGILIVYNEGDLVFPRILH